MANDIRALVDRLNQTAYEYYVLDEPTISDKEWDALYDELAALEKETGTVLPDSPTRRVGGEPLSAFAQHRHLARLWSMDKAQSQGALWDWARRAEKLREQAVQDGIPLPALRYAVEHKFDGLTINLTYDGGELIQAATRGNGEVGEAILEQVRTINSVPLSIPYQGRIEVQGEGYMRLSALELYNKTAPEPLKNPRNGAAGALRNLDPSAARARRLSANFYNVGYIEGRSFQDQAEMIEFLHENRFPAPSCEVYCDTFEEAIAAVLRIEEQRSELDYMIDGAVIKLTDFETRRALGYTDKFPRWAVAYKFEAEEVTSTLIDVTWDPGRTGKLTPLAHLSPVEIAGATIRRATLNNYGDIQRKRVRLGARVWLRRSNEVIPEIMGRVEEYEPGERDIEKPSACPACGAELQERGAHLFCPNTDGCRPQIVARLSHFAGREAMDIDTFSEKTAAQLYDELGVKQAAQLYQLTLQPLCALNRFGEKKAQNLLSALEKSKKVSLDAFVYALGIPNVGRKTAYVLADKYQSLDALMAASQDELTQLPDVGEVVGGSITGFFEDRVQQAHVRALLDAGIAPEWEARIEGGALSGLTIVVTGTLGSLSRSEAEQKILRAGGKPGSSVSKHTSFVVAGESAGSKLEKAHKLGVKVIDEAEFLRLLGEKVNPIGSATVL